MNTLSAQRKTRTLLAELERTKDERNRAGMLVRGEYLSQIKALQAEVRRLRAAGWTLINRNQSNLPKTGFVVAGSYRDGAWSTSSPSHGYGYPGWADDDRTHFYRLPGPPPKPQNA